MADRTALEVKGFIFEGFIGIYLHNNFNKSFHYYNKKFESSLLKKGETQIDLIFITSRAIFVIEAKNWSQFISGTYDDYEWTGMGDAHKVMKVFSPVYQNYYHLRLLKAAMSKKEKDLPPFYNLVVVPDGCEIRTECEEVVNVSSLKNKIIEKARLSTKEYNLNKLYSLVADA